MRDRESSGERERIMDARERERERERERVEEEEKEIRDRSNVASAFSTASAVLFYYTIYGFRTVSGK